MMISCDTLASTFNSFPEAVLVVMKRSLQRYIRYQISIRLIKKYGMVTMNDTYWVQRREFVGTDSIINRKLESAVTNFWEDLAELQYQ